VVAVKIASAQIKPYRRKLIEPLRTAHGEIIERCGSIIALTSDEGHTGFGEAPLPSFIGDNNDTLVADTKSMLIASIDSLVGKDIPSSLEEVEGDIGHIFAAEDASVYFGLETALCDLATKIVGLPLSRWLSPDARTSIPVNYLIRRPVADWDKLVSVIAKHGYRAVKVKVAVNSIDDDVRFIETFRAILGDDIAIRLDANRGWDFDTASTVLNRMARFGIDYIEEPLTKFDPANLSKLRSKINIPIALDESLTEIKDFDDMLSAKIANVLILKPSLIGGMARTLEIIKRAEQYDCRYIITTNLETEIGTSALLHLAAAVPGDLHPCGLDTLRLFEKADPALTKVENGAIKVPPGAGLGIKEELWARL
jgi:o-succinylbenzoate synthase